MKKLSGILATGLALSLVFGMTAFAADSKTAKDVKTETATQSAVTVEAWAMGTETVAAVDEEAAAKDEALTKEVQEKGVANDTVTSTVTTSAGAVDVTISNVTNAELKKLESKMEAIAEKATYSDEKAVDVTIEKIFDLDVTLAGTSTSVTGQTTITIKGLGLQKEENTEYIVIHLLGSTVKREPATVNDDGSLTMTVGSFSPFAVVSYKVESTSGEEEAGASTNVSNTGSGSASGAATSPKTAETFPVAGLVALVAVAGAAISFKKVRYTK